MLKMAKHLVIGGAGFLGSHIVQFLKANTQIIEVLVFDLVAPDSSSEAWVQGVEYEVGDIVDEERLIEVFRRFNPDVVYHTASPIHGLSSDIYYRVNQRGTAAVLSACKAVHVTKLIYTSSTGVVWTGADVIGATEDDLPVPPKGYDAYHHTKALGEQPVLGQNGVDGLQVVVLRPCGMTGERDKQLIWRLAKVLNDGQQNIQIGDNTNLVDHLYVGNAAYAHVLAADCLLRDPKSVAGEIFFITNGSPMHNWDFNRLIWKELGDNSSKSIIKIPRSVAIVMAMISEIWSKITCTPTEFNRFNIRFITGIQWYNIEKACRILGYQPRISLEEGVYRTVKWWKATGAAQHSQDQKRKKD